MNIEYCPHCRNDHNIKSVMRPDCNITGGRLLICDYCGTQTKRDYRQEKQAEDIQANRELDKLYIATLRVKG